MIDENKLIEDLIPILNKNNDMYLAGKVIGCIDAQPKIGEWIPVSERIPEYNVELLYATMMVKFMLHLYKILFL